MKKTVQELAIRFAFGFGISAAAGIVGVVATNRIGGVLLGFPAILPASLTLIERHDGRHSAAIDATGAILGSAALVAFAVIATLSLTAMPAAIALGLAGAAWLAVGLGLYVLAVRLPLRRKRDAKRAKPTTT